MTYHALGETSSVKRAAWCPVQSLRPGQRDPCEIRYSFDLPLVGETEFGLPIPAITNDAINTVKQQMPELYRSMQPYIEDVKASAFADLEYFVPELVGDVIDAEIMPIVEREKENIQARAEMLVGDTLKVAFVMTATVVAAVGIAAWWVKT
jgi:hypothetical protein